MADLWTPDTNMEPTTLTKEEKGRCDAVFRSILSTLRANMVPDSALICKAYDFAYKCHDGQRRKGGDPFIIHPLEVARILAEASFTDNTMICSALLHDVVEDCGISVHRLADYFTPEIAETVDDVSQIDALFSGDPEIQKDDLDALSDVKLLTMAEIKRDRRAFYIKLADRIHNLRTIRSFPEEKQKAKALHTRNILIPAAKELHVFTLIDVLENLCLEIENPALFQSINRAYGEILRENDHILSEKNGFRAFFLESIQSAPISVQKSVVSLLFEERKSESIARNLPDIQNLSNLQKYLTKEYIPVYDIKFIVSDLYKGSALDIFLRLYPTLHGSRYQFTITGIGRAVGSGNRFFKCEDRFGCRYRLFILKETDTLKYLYGACMDGSGNDVRSHIPYINSAQPDEPYHRMIRIYRKNGKADEIEEGATVLDFAFHLNPAIGLCATGARINGGTALMPLYTRLRPGDLIDVQSDHISSKDREKEEYKDKDDIPHATVRWFEYLHTREAIKDLSRWLESHGDFPHIKITVSCRKQEYTIPIGCTVLDFVINHFDKPFEGFHVYINKSKTPADIHKILLHRDNIRIRTEEEDMDMPDITWFGILKTDSARQKLIQYFQSRQETGALGSCGEGDGDCTIA